MSVKKEKYLKQYPEAAKRALSSGPWPLCGVEELRDAVDWANATPEDKHDWKTAEFRKARDEH
jgi:hypothetical protein